MYIHPGSMKHLLYTWFCVKSYNTGQQVSAGGQDTANTVKVYTLAHLTPSRQSDFRKQKELQEVGPTLRKSGGPYGSQPGPGSTSNLLLPLPPWYNQMLMFLPTQLLTTPTTTSSQQAVRDPLHLRALPALTVRYLVTLM